MAAETPSARGPALLARSDVRLACFGLSAVLAVYTGFLGIPVRTAETLVKRGGYHLMLLTFALFVCACWRLRHEALQSVRSLTRGQQLGAAAAIAVFSVMAFTAEPYHSKILNDEFVLQSTAFNLHYFRDVVTMVRGYEIEGVFLSTDNYLDKRPYFYPFLVSLAHDLTGYRIANAFVVNSVLLPVALALAYAFGRLLHGAKGGLLAVLLLGSLPLLGQNATGSGMELLNTVMILAALLLGTLYLRQPDGPRLVAFALGVVLLAESRYESALYVLPAAVVIAVGWARSRRLILPWPVVLVPFLLLPVALQNKVLSNTPILWEVNEKSAGRFDFSYFAANSRGALSYLFNRSIEHSNSLVLSLMGIPALVYCLWQVGRQARRGLSQDPARAALVCFGAAILANTLLVFCYYWARFDDPMASRFSLPLHLLLAFAAVIAIGAIGRGERLSRGVLLVVALAATSFATAKYGLHHYSHLGIDETEWQRRWINGRQPVPRLVVSNQSTLPWLLQKTPSILIGRARAVSDRLQTQLREPTFTEILVLQSLRPSMPDGDHQLVPDDKLPPNFELETLAERRFGTRISRISRLVAIHPADNAGGPDSPRPSAGGEAD